MFFCVVCEQETVNLIYCRQGQICEDKESYSDLDITADETEEIRFTDHCHCDTCIPQMFRHCFKFSDCVLTHYIHCKDCGFCDEMRGGKCGCCDLDCDWYGSDYDHDYDPNDKSNWLPTCSIDACYG